MEKGLLAQVVKVGGGISSIICGIIHKGGRSKSMAGPVSSNGVVGVGDTSSSGRSSKSKVGDKVNLGHCQGGPGAA